MSRTKLTELNAQIALLQKEAEELVKSERNAVIREIKDKLGAYHITVEELQRKVKPASTKTTAVIKYRKDEHNYWVGRGPKPKWVKEIEEQGENVELYRVPV